MTAGWLRRRWLARRARRTVPLPGEGSTYGTSAPTTEESSGPAARGPQAVPQSDGLDQPCIIRQASPKGEPLAITRGCCSSGRAGHMERRHGAIGDLIARSWGNGVLGVRGREFGARSTGAAEPGAEVAQPPPRDCPRVEPESRSSGAFDFEISTTTPLCSPAQTAKRAKTPLFGRVLVQPTYSGQNGA